MNLIKSFPLASIIRCKLTRRLTSGSGVWSGSETGKAREACGSESFTLLLLFVVAAEDFPPPGKMVVNFLSSDS